MPLAFDASLAAFLPKPELQDAGQDALAKKAGATGPLSFKTTSNNTVAAMLNFAPTPAAIRRGSSEGSSQQRPVGSVRPVPAVSTRCRRRSPLPFPLWT